MLEYKTPSYELISVMTLCLLLWGTVLLRLSAVASTIAKPTPRTTSVSRYTVDFEE